MKKILFLFLTFFMILFNCGDAGTADGDDTDPANNNIIIADHTVVELYDDIPPEWINEVKKMLVDIAGESHSAAYRDGMDALEVLNSDYQVTTFDGSIPGVTDTSLRLGRHGSVGEEDFYTNQIAIDNIKQLVTNQHNSGNPINVLGLGWCWDTTWHNNPTSTRDPVYNVGWAGSSVGGPEGDLPWGLNSDDELITYNTVSMDTYLNAVVQYNQHCTDNGYNSVVIFTTGPVDGNNGNENGFQREIKHDYIRNYVNTNGGILFDYADILYYNNAGELAEYTWNDGGNPRVYKGIHPDNDEKGDGEDTGHIGNAGALRLAKAMWWLLARIAGWDGN